MYQMRHKLYILLPHVVLAVFVVIYNANWLLLVQGSEHRNVVNNDRIQQDHNTGQTQSLYLKKLLGGYLQFVSDTQDYGLPVRRQGEKWMTSYGMNQLEGGDEFQDNPRSLNTHPYTHAYLSQPTQDQVVITDFDKKSMMIRISPHGKLDMHDFRSKLQIYMERQSISPQELSYIEIVFTNNGGSKEDNQYCVLSFNQLHQISMIITRKHPHGIVVGERKQIHSIDEIIGVDARYMAKLETDEFGKRTCFWLRHKPSQKSFGIFHIEPTQHGDYLLIEKDNSILPTK